MERKATTVTSMFTISAILIVAGASTAALGAGISAKASIPRTSISAIIQIENIQAASAIARVEGINADAISTIVRIQTQYKIETADLPAQIRPDDNLRASNSIQSISIAQDIDGSIASNVGAIRAIKISGNIGANILPEIEATGAIRKISIGNYRRLGILPKAHDLPASLAIPNITAHRVASIPDQYQSIITTINSSINGRIASSIAGLIVDVPNCSIADAIDRRIVWDGNRIASGGVDARLVRISAINIDHYSKNIGKSSGDIAIGIAGKDILSSLESVQLTPPIQPST